MSKPLSQQDKPTPEQAAALLGNVAARARERLLPFMEDDYNRHYETPDARQFAVSTMMKQAAEAPDLSTATLSGYCGHAQHFVDAELKTLGLKTHWYTLEKAPTGDNAKWFQENGVTPTSELLNNKATQNHVALTVEIETTEGKKHYLVDPTFRQFRTADPQSPGRLLENSLGDGLAKTGVLELTPERAASYLAAFSGGQSPHATLQQSVDFLTTVPDRRQSKGSFPPADYLDSKAPAHGARAMAHASAPLPALSPDETAATLKGWYVLRGYSADHDPLSTVMDLDRDAAIAKMKEVHPTRGIGEADANGHRDQTKYYELRAAADKWVRENSTAIKERDNPIFMAVTNDPETVRRHMNSPGHNVLVMPLSEVDKSKISITVDDSMGNYRTTVLDTKNTGINGEFLPDIHPQHGKVLSVDQFAALVKAGGIDGVDGAPRTIEGQYWGKEPLKAQIHAYDPLLPKPPRPGADASPHTPPVKLYHGTSEAFLGTILQDGFEPRYMSARERMRSVMEGVAGEGNVSDAQVDKMVEQRQRRALEAGNVVYTSPDPAVSRGYAINFRATGGELSHQVQGIMNAHNQPGRFDGARPVLLELEVEGRALKTEMHDYEVLVRAGKDISVKSVTFAERTLGGYSFDGQPALPPDEAMRQISPDFAGKVQPKRDLDPEQQKILKALDDFAHGSGAGIGRTGTMYVAETTMKDADGHTVRVKVPEPDFKPQAAERFEQYGFKGIAASYTMPHDLIPAEVNGYVTVLDIREQRGEITAADKAASLKTLFTGMEEANPALKGVAFDRNDPSKVSDMLRGAINGYSPENLQHHVSGSRVAGYDTLKNQAIAANSLGADIDLAPAALHEIKAEMERKYAALDAQRHPVTPEKVTPVTPEKVTAPVVKTPDAHKPVASATDGPAPEGSAHGTQAKLGRATGAAQIAVDVAAGNYGSAATGAAVEIGLNARTYEAAADLTSAIKPVAKALGFLGKRIPVIGAAVTAGFVLWEVGAYALEGKYGKATAALGAGAAEAAGNIVGFGVGDVARETVRGAVIATAGEDYAVNKSGIRQLGETAYTVGSKFVSGTPEDKKETTPAATTTTATSQRPKTPGM